MTGTSCPSASSCGTKELMSYIDFPPLQLAASYNLEQVLDQVQEMSKDHPSQ